MGWIALLALAAIAGVALWRFGGMSRSGLELLGAALLLGVAGYAWQGSPSLPGKPTPPKTAQKQPDSNFVAERANLMERMGGAAQILEAADALHRQGLDAYAVATIRAGLNSYPDNPDLLVGLGNALILYADGMVSPAARLAFDRAAKIAPDHPGPPYFIGLAYVQAQQFDRAEDVWQGLLDRSPPEAPWRAQVAEKLDQLRMMRMQQGG